MVDSMNSDDNSKRFDEYIIYYLFIYHHVYIIYYLVHKKATRTNSI